MTPSRFLSALLCVLLVAASAYAQQRRAYPTEILFQGFTWDANVNGKTGVWYRNLEAQAEELAGAGVTHVWFPPPSRSVAPQGYMPGDWYDLGTDANPTLYGTHDQLKHAVAALRAKNIASVADIVINHRCASHQENGVWNVFHHASGKASWERWAIAKDDYAGTGAPDTGADFGAAPDIDHTNARVREDVKAWLKWLRDDVGFTGLRFDYSKGYGAHYAKEYVDAVQPEFAVGEYWSSMDYANSEMSPVQDHHRQQVTDWVDGTKGASTAFDFTTKGLLQEAVGRSQYWRLRDRQGKAAGLIGWWPDHAVTFVDNHDTGSTQAHWPFPGEHVQEGYAYILTHPGVPTIFWDHYMTWGPEVRATIKKLAQLRHDLGIHRASQLEIVVADDSQYAAKVDGKLAVRLGRGGWEPGAGWKARMNGPGFAIWVRE
jgi:alpha-amylase